MVNYFDRINDLYNRSHGGMRYFLSQLPVSGKIRQFADNVRKWDDAYANTGRDPNYSTAYGSAGIPFVNDALAPLTKPMRMARTLSKMYGAEVELDIAKERHATARQYGHNAELWRSAWEERNKKQ